MMCWPIGEDILLIELAATWLDQEQHLRHNNLQQDLAAGDVEYTIYCIHC